jgi:predicted ATPase
VKEGAGQVVLLSGEPGIGKSRLLQVLKERITTEQYTRLECRCSPYHQNSAFYPVIDLLQRVLQFQREDAAEEKLRKLEGALKSYNFALQEAVPLFASLLSLPLPEQYPPLTLTPQKQKEKTQQAVITWLLKEAERHSLLLTWEDLQWADPSSLELLGFLIAQATTARIYLLLTFRPEFIPPWANRSHLTPLTLSRLPQSQVEIMVTQVTGGKALSPAVLQQIVAKTDGVPLFVEELTKMVIESIGSMESVGSVGSQDRSSLQAIAIPATLHDSLMARLDRLGPGKEVAQLGATLGREFSYELLQAVSSRDEVTLQRELARLVDAELLFQRGLLPHARYVFKHALIQDAAYQSLLKSTRQQYHRQIAQVLAERFPETKETQPELLAHHYTEANLREQAIPYWQQAGQRAIAHSANIEAISHLTKGLELLKTLPDTPERTEQELTLQIALSNPLMAIKGYAALEVERTCSRALELCRQLGETPRLFPVLLGLLAFHQVRAELQTARELAEQCLRLAQRVRSPTRLMWAHNVLGHTLFYLGEFALAREHSEQGITLYDPQKHTPLVSGAMQDTGVSCLCFAALALWWLGYPVQAARRSQEALSLAQDLAHPYSLAMAQFYAASLHQFRGERLAAREQVEALLALSSEQGFAFWLAYGTILRGWVLAEEGQGEEGIAQIRQGLAACRATGAELYRPYHLTLLAKAYGKANQAEDRLSAMSEALMLVDKTGERFYEAELYRLKGELLLTQEGNRLQAIGHREKMDEAEECFLKAIEIARKQQAKSLELRAAMSLSRLWQQQGKRAEARQMLAEIYGWFTEGFDTKDLQEAKALLQEMAL